MLDAWACSPTRFREDANAEEDLALGGYRDRLLVELLQNAADAAVRADGPGRVRVRLVDGELRVANTGAPLDVEGVRALASLRASAKRDATTTGRFGVGFAAVLAVSDEPAVLSHDGGVRFSARRTRDAVAVLPTVARELDRRGGSVPVLRLPWPAGDRPPAGFTTEVRLPLRPGVEQDVRQALADLDPALLLALPQLSVVDLAGRVLRRGDDGADVVIDDAGGSTRWRCATASGVLPTGVLDRRPTEERGRTRWSVLWAVPVVDGGPQPLAEPQALHAPTPSEEPVPVPARLVATFPLDPDRRHVAPGPATDWLVDRVARTYADLLAGLAPAAQVLALVPPPALGGAALSTALGQAILDRLRSAAWLPVAGGGAPVDATEARALEPPLEEATDVLADVLPGLLPATWSARPYRRSLDTLGVARLGLAAVVEAVAALDRPPTWWRELYAVLAAGPDRDLDRDALGALPVPLADGRLVTGARGALLPGPDFPDGVAEVLDLRLVHRAAVHPLLERLGAHEASVQAVLQSPSTRALVEASFDTPGFDTSGFDAAADPEPLAEAVLALVRAAGVRPGDLPWLSGLALPGDDGEIYPAGELLLPGSPLAAVMADDAPFGTVAGELVERFGADALRACGVLDSFALVDESDVDTADDAYDLDSGEQWLVEGGRGVPAVVERLVGVRDLELVRADAWPAALALLATEPLRSAVATDAVVRDADGMRAAPSYTRWWLSRHPVLDWREPRTLRLSGAAELAGLYDAAPPGQDQDFLRVIGCLGSLADVLADADGARGLLDRLGDPRRRCSPVLLGWVYGRLAAVLVDDDVPPPERVRVAPGRVVGADQAVLLDRPWLVPLLDNWVAIPCRTADRDAVADLLDLPLASEVANGVPRSSRRHRQAWRDVPGIGLACQRLGADVPVGALSIHTGLSVHGRPVPWWVENEGEHVDGEAGAAAMGRALAWRLGAWDRRAAAAEALAAPDEDSLRTEDATG